MKLSSDASHPDYHPVVIFVDKILVDGTKIERAVHVDTKLGEAQVVSLPIKAVDGIVATHVVRGNVEIVWRTFPKSENGIIGTGSERVFEMYKAEWEEKEKSCPQND